MPKVSFIEIAVDNALRAQEFYKNVFGWSFKAMSGPTEYYYGQPEDGGSVGIGMMPRQMPEQHITTYVTVESVDASLEKIQASGGALMLPKHAVPGMGWFAIVMDTEGNGLAIWQDDKSAA